MTHFASCSKLQLLNSFIPFLWQQRSVFVDYSGLDTKMSHFWLSSKQQTPQLALLCVSQPLSVFPTVCFFVSVSLRSLLHLTPSHLLQILTLTLVFSPFCAHLILPHWCFPTRTPLSFSPHNLSRITLLASFFPPALKESWLSGWYQNQSFTLWRWITGFWGLDLISCHRLFMRCSTKCKIAYSFSFHWVF